MAGQLSTGNDWLWMHCSSAGEFEQGKPLAEALKKNHPQYKLLITFFSPSGYEAATNYPLADGICYLALDTRKAAERFLNLVNPKLAVFVKYEFWYHHLSATASRRIPLLLVSAVFRKEQIFFKSYGRFFKTMLRFFDHIFVQDDVSFQLLKEAGINRCSISGDTRFDRVKEISVRAKPVPFVATFLQNKKSVVAGSTWPDDEAVLKDFASAYPQVILIIAPHEVNAQHLHQLKTLFPEAVFYSSLNAKTQGEAQVLIIDCVGLLSRLYQHATITYVGGGFTRDGIHNVLEAAVWSKPVVFGPNYKKYREAKDLIEAGGGFSLGKSDELKALVNDFFRNEQRLQTASKNAGVYVEQNTGATQKIMQFIQEKRLLTRL